MKKSELKQIIKEEIKKALNEEQLALSKQEITSKSPATGKSILDIYNMLSEIDDIDFIQEVGFIISRKDWNSRGEFSNKQTIYREIAKHMDDKGMINDLEDEIYNQFKRGYSELNESYGDEETGLMVSFRSPADATAFRDAISNTDYYYEWNAREGYFFFPEEEEMYDELEMQLQQIMDDVDVNGSIEGIF